MNKKDETACSLPSAIGLRPAHLRQSAAAHYAHAYARADDGLAAEGDAHTVSNKTGADT